MFYRYEIIRQNNEDILYLYLTMKYEFSNDFNLQDDQDLGRRTNNFIQTNHIPFSGNKVFLIIDDMVVKSIDLSNTPKTFSPDYSFTAEEFLVHIELDDGAICEVSLKEYLLSILFSKYMENIHEEVLKAICILYTTYIYKTMAEEGRVLASNSFAIYKPVTYYKAIFNNYDTIFNKLQSVIQEVDGMFVRYKNEYILPFIHYSNTGKTNTHPSYSYLSSVKSLWDLTSPYYVEVNDFTYDEISNKLNILVTKDSDISIHKDQTIQRILIDKHVFQIDEFKTLLNLKSTYLYIIFYRDFIRIITSGWGNAYGLSIYGANDIANNGGKYYQILKYYFPKTKLYIYTRKEHS